MSSYSIIIPVKDEVKSILPLYTELKRVLLLLKKPYEIIFIDDGSEDNSVSEIKKLSKKDTNVKLIVFRGNFGKSAALSAGFEKAKGEITITIDADLQDDPKEIPKLLKKLHEGYDFVSGWRKSRNDSLTKKISSKLFNLGTSFISGVKLHDFNCGLKVFTKEVREALNLHGELHRFIPVLAAREKFKVSEVAVNHRSRKYGKSKFGLGRSWRGILDLLTIIFITDYGSKPAHFFGGIGLLFFTIGFIISAYITYIRLVTGSIQYRLPLLLLGILCIVLGVQLFCTGLIAELIVYFNIKKSTHEDRY